MARSAADQDALLWPRSAIAASALVILAILFGGGTRSGFLGDILAQLAAIPIIIAAIWSSWRHNGIFGRQLLVPLLFLVLCFVTFAVHLIPLSSTAIEWHDTLAGMRNIPDVNQSRWTTLSISPHATRAAAASLLPPIAAFLLVAQMNWPTRRKLCLTILALGGLSLTLGAAQIIHGADSPLRWFTFTNRSEPVGFFANRNHFSAQLYLTLMLTTPWLIISARPDLIGHANDRQHPLASAGLYVFIIAVAAGITVTRSRAGIALALTGLFGMALVTLTSQASRSTHDHQHRTTPAGAIVGALFFAGLCAGQLGLHRFSARLSEESLGPLRATFTSTTLDAALDNLPFGTGPGTFRTAYAIAEKTDDAFTAHANRAHNDFAELFLETGFFGVLLCFVFVAWFFARARCAWLHSPPSASAFEISLQRCSTICIALVLVHSFVDYPLRTTAVSTLFGVLCGLLLSPPNTTAARSSNAPAANLSNPPSTPSRPRTRS